MTTIAALQCVERGLFTLDSAEDVKRLIPERTSFNDILTGFDDSGNPVFKKAAAEITTRQFLTHTSGVGYDLTLFLERWRKHRGEESLTLSGEIIKGYLTPLTFNPGDSWEYGAGLDWAGLMIERANGGKKLGQFMKENIWDPLGMTSTTFHLEEQEDVRTRLASMSVRLPSGEIAPFNVSVLKDPAKDDLGGAGIFSTATDYLRILASILRNDEKLLKKESVEEMFTPQLTPVQKAAYMKLADGIPGLNTHLAGRLKPGTEITWGLGGAIIEEDVPDGRKKGSMFWGGLPNLCWVCKWTLCMR